MLPLHKDRSRPEDTESEYMTSAEAAALAGRSHAWLYKQAELGRIKRYKQGSRALFSRAEMMKLIAPAPIVAVEVAAPKKRRPPKRSK